MPIIYTIGHSTHPIDRFLALLAGARIEAVADVRSSPWSRVNPQFNREPFREALAGAGVQYVFLGEELGARSKDPKCYVNGKASYERIAGTVLFKSGIERVLAGAAKMSVALMCAEAEPLDCHRARLVAPRLVARGAEVRHILRDGTVESHDSVMDRLLARAGAQPADLFLSREALVEEALRRSAGGSPAPE